MAAYLSFRPPHHVAPHRVSLRRHPLAVLHPAALRIHSAPRGAALLLGEQRAVGRGAARRLALHGAIRSAARRHPARAGQGDCAPHPGGQALYAFGALLCLWDTYAGIAFIVAVQLNFAIAPRVPWLSGF